MMACFLSVAKNIVIAILFGVGLIVVSSLFMAAGFGTATVFGWIDNPIATTIFGLFYMAVAGGIIIGIEECRGRL